MQLCYKCKRLKSFSEFYCDNSRLSGYSNICKICDKLRLKEHYANNKTQYYKSSVLSRSKRKALIDSIKGGNGCFDCNEFYPPYVMEFDHIRFKKFDISEGLTRVALKDLLFEIEKCDCVCTNCEYVCSYKENNPCSDCLEYNSYFQMDFDHLKNKKFKISKAIYSTSLKNIKDEMAKCDLVCGNCHKIRTYIRFVINKT